MNVRKQLFFAYLGACCGASMFCMEKKITFRASTCDDFTHYKQHVGEDLTFCSHPDFLTGQNALIQTIPHIDGKETITILLGAHKLYKETIKCTLGADEKKKLVAVEIKPQEESTKGITKWQSNPENIITFPTYVVSKHRMQLLTEVLNAFLKREFEQKKSE